MITEKIKKEAENRSQEGKLSCREAFKIAEELERPVKEVGEACNELKIKIVSCQLGCF